jgi:DNA-binding beta-propeller fold protein YncE
VHQGWETPVRASVALFALLSLVLFVAPTAPAATGDLTFAQCFDDDDSNLEAAKCAGAPGLDRSSSVAVSPDGKSVYAASFLNHAVVRFNRNSTTGALTFGECIEAVTDIEGTACSDAPGLLGANSVAVSRDGRSVYVASLTDDAIVRFNRDTTTGDIGFAQCFQDRADSPTDAPECMNTSGLNGAGGVAAAPDGRSLYVASLADDAVMRFSRNATTGALAFAQCFDDQDTNPEAACTGAPGLDDATSVEVSRDGKSLYAAAAEDDAIVRFNRTTIGAIGFAQCFQDKADALADEAECADRAGLNGASSVAVSADGRSLYAASFFDFAIARFNRNTTTGALTFAECFDDEDAGPEAACPGAPGLANVNSVTVSGDGGSLYAAGLGDNAIVRFNRTTSGDISFAQCFDDEDTNLEGPKCLGAPALDAIASVAVSPDGRSLYTAALDDDAVARFNRELPPAPPGTTPSNEFSFGKLKRNKRKGTAKLTIEIVEGPGELELAKTEKVKADDQAVEREGATEDKLKIKPKGKARKKLGKKGRAKVKAEVTYTPTGGEPNTESKRVKLVKR